MATTTQLRADITKLKKAIASKFTPKSAKSKLEAQLKKVEKELADKKSGKKTASTTASTQATFKSLRDLVRRTKELKIYKGSTEGDLQNDAERSALPSSAVKGRRTSKGLRSNQYGTKGSNKGHIYYEYRKNRIDVKQPRSKQKYPILEDGGMMADGGGTNQKYVVYGVTKVDNKVKILKEADSFNLANNWLERYIDKGLDDEFEKMGYMPKSKFEKEKEFLKMADGGMMAKGGGVSKNTTYVPNRDVKELSLVLKGELKKLKGSDILDGVYVKNKISRQIASKSNASASDILKKIKSKLKSKDPDSEKSLVVDESDIQSLIDVGLNEKDIMVCAFGFGYEDKAKIKCDNEFKGYMSGFAVMTEDYQKKSISNVRNSINSGYYEIGLKYPSFDWKKIVDKYKISGTPKIIETSRRKYEVYIGNGVAIGHSFAYIDYKDKWQEDKDELIGKIDFSSPSKYQSDRGYSSGFNGGYWGVVTKSKEAMYDIVDELVSQKKGYLKDLEVFTNGLGGIGYEDVEGKFADGGMMAKGGEANEMKERQEMIKKGWIHYDKDHFMNTESGMIVVKSADLNDIKPKEIKGFDRLGTYADGGMMAKGGAVAHGLKRGDVIGRLERFSIYVYNKIDKNYYIVNLDKGERSEANLSGAIQSNYWNFAEGGMAEMGMEMPNGGGIQSSTHKLTR